MRKADLIEIVVKCRDGDNRAWNKLIKQVSPMIFSICHSMNLSREESFDIFGQVSYLILRNLNKLKSPEKLLSYVATTTRREIYALSRRVKLFEYIMLTELSGGRVRVADTPDKIYEKTKGKELLQKAVLTLPQRDSDLIQLLFLDTSEPKYEEISEKLQIPVSSIGPTRARSLEKLRKLLKKKGFNFQVI